MSEKPIKPNPGELKLRKTVVKDMPLRSGKANKVKGGGPCTPVSCPTTKNHAGEQ